MIIAVKLKTPLKVCRCVWKKNKTKHHLFKISWPATFCFCFLRRILSLSKNTTHMHMHTHARNPEIVSSHIALFAVTRIYVTWSRSAKSAGHSPPRRVHPRREDEQEQDEGEACFGDGSGAVLPPGRRCGRGDVRYAPRTHGPSHVRVKAAPAGVKVLGDRPPPIIGELFLFCCCKNKKPNKQIKK